MTLQWNRYRSTESLDEEISVELAVSLFLVLHILTVLEKETIKNSLELLASHVGGE
jgi:hypothetical protein